MKKSVYVSIMVAILLVPQFVLAEMDLSSENKKGIYYCTKDLHKLESSSISSNKSVSGYNNEYIRVSRDDDILHTFLRHCFIIYAEEIAMRDNSADVSGDAVKVIFRIIDSIGYGVDRNEDKYGTVASEQWLVIPEERNKYTVSCTKIMREGALKEDGASVDTIDLLNAFNRLSYDMRKDALEAPYSVATHNCCSAAYNSVINNPSFFSKDDVSNINKRAYNILGMGIKFEWTAEDFVESLKASSTIPGDLIKGSFISSSKSSSYVVTTVVSLFKENADNGGEQEKKEDL